MRVFVVIFTSLFVSGCLGIPKGVYPIDEFDLNKYLGTWYEIARLDHSFERGLDKVTAEYS
ncbi:MAG: lipocalin family protein, partial [Deltaproteobacteria bacterium]|nr:lipocalin family protein [Deltaproteobacteria bacterium]